MDKKTCKHLKTEKVYENIMGEQILKVKCLCQLKQKNDTKIYPEMMKAVEGCGIAYLPNDECQFIYNNKMEECPYCESF